jgi:glyoxylase I family protein
MAARGFPGLRSRRSRGAHGWKETGVSEYTRFNHVTIAVRDVERVARFYEDVVGLKRLPRPNLPWAGAWFDLGGKSRLNLAEEAAPPAHTRGDVGLEVDDFDGVVGALEKQGAQFAEGPGRFENSGRRYFKIFDPAGNKIEVVSEPGA